jgi:hypothetical protein
MLSTTYNSLDSVAKGKSLHKPGIELLARDFSKRDIRDLTATTIIVISSSRFTPAATIMY